jgi:uncharacterized membrane protein
MWLLYFTILGSVIAVLADSPLLGLAVATIIIVWIAFIAWRSRHDPWDPTVY